MHEKIAKLLKSFEDKGKEVKELLAKEQPTAEEIAKIKALNAERTQLKEQMEAIKESEELAEFEKTPTKDLPMPSPQDSTGDFNAFLKSIGMQSNLLGVTPAGSTHLQFDQFGMLKHLSDNGAGIFGQDVWLQVQTKSYKMAFAKYLRKGVTGLSSGDLKDLELGLDPQGGYLAPPEWIARIVSRAPTPTRVAGMVTNLTTSRSGIVMPRVNYNENDLYSTGFRVKWTGENPVVTNGVPEHRVSDRELFGETRIDVHTAMMSIVLKNDMVEDSAFPLEAFVADKFDETVMLAKDNMILNGDGVNQPLGIFPASTLAHPDEAVIAVNSGNANSLTVDGLIDITYEVPEQYDENARFVFNKRSTGKAIAKLKTTDGELLFSNELGNRGVATARPSTLLGYGYAYSGFCPNVAANTTPIAFGDFRGYSLLQRIGLSIQVLREKYAEENAVCMVARLRIGGKPLEPWKMRVQKVAA